MKSCSKCGETKPYSEFPKRIASRDGYRGTCKRCRAKVHNDWRNQNIYKARLQRMESYYRNREKEILSSKKNHELHPEWHEKALLNYKNKNPYYDALRQRRRSSNVPFGDIKKLGLYLKSLNQVCHYCGVTKEDLANSPNNYHSGSALQIDKVNPSLGYVEGNIVLACPICNYVKGRWFGEQTMKEIGVKYISRIWHMQPDEYL